jgi:uncharacterized membrane protein
MGIFITIFRFKSPLTDYLLGLFGPLLGFGAPELVLATLILILLLLFLIWILAVSKRMERILRDYTEEMLSEIKAIHQELKITAKGEVTEPVSPVPSEEKPEEEKEEEKEEVKKVITEERAEPEKPRVEKAEKAPKKEEKLLEFDEEHIFILASIADEPERSYQKEGLFNLFKMVFPLKDRPDFEAILKDFQKANFIKAGETSDYMAWLEMTEEGLEYLKKKRGY